MHYVSLYVDRDDVEQDPTPLGYVSITAVPRTVRERLRAFSMLLRRGPRYYLSEEVVIDPAHAREIIDYLTPLAAKADEL